MGLKPKRLAEKLLQIRFALALSQKEMAERIGMDMPYQNISKYERGRSVPSLKVVLAYAQAVGVSMEQLVDDVLDLKLSPLNLAGIHRAKGATKTTGQR